MEYGSGCSDQDPTFENWILPFGMTGSKPLEHPDPDPTCRNTDPDLTRKPDPQPLHAVCRSRHDISATSHFPPK